MKAYKNHLLLHFVILLWGFTGILGKLISLPSTSIVWYRMFIAVVSLLVFYLYKPFQLKLSSKEYAKLFGTGAIVAIHWIMFFEAIKVSNVSVALTTLASTTLFTSILEPIFFKKRFVFYEFLFGAIIILGLFLIFNFESQYTLGILFALISALGAAMFTVLNGTFISEGTPARSITFYEMLGGLVGITVYKIILGGFTSAEMISQPSHWISDSIYILILGIICTAFAFAVSVNVMKELSPFTVSISINMEPIYSILLALMIFGESEKMTSGFYIGAVLILSTIFGNALLKKILKNKNKI